MTQEARQEAPGGIGQGREGRLPGLPPDHTLALHMPTDYPKPTPGQQALCEQESDVSWQGGAPELTPLFQEVVTECCCMKVLCWDLGKMAWPQQTLRAPWL